MTSQPNAVQPQEGLPYPRLRIIAIVLIFASWFSLLAFAFAFIGFAHMIDNGSTIGPAADNAMLAILGFFVLSRATGKLLQLIVQIAEDNHARAGRKPRL